GGGSIDADITVTVRPLVGGRPLGGTRENVHVEGAYGYLWDVEDSDFVDVDALEYHKSGLRER
ncbi:MAG: hypothetical protein HYY62_04255, partial [Deltaproteobacteria bacterium]|nr:hypothetical protein [Deltaproteobacteria bacterium]